MFKFTIFYDIVKSDYTNNKYIPFLIIYTYILIVGAFYIYYYSKAWIFLVILKALLT